MRKIKVITITTEDDETFTVEGSGYYHDVRTVQYDDAHKATPVHYITVSITPGGIDD